MEIVAIFNILNDLIIHTPKMCLKFHTQTVDLYLKDRSEQGVIVYTVYFVALCTLFTRFSNCVVCILGGFGKTLVQNCQLLSCPLSHLCIETRPQCALYS